MPSASNQDQVLRVPEELSGLGPLSGEAAPRNGFWSMPLQLRRRDAQLEEVSFLVLFFLVPVVAQDVSDDAKVTKIRSRPPRGFHPP